MATLNNNDIVPGFDAGRDAGISILLERIQANPRCLKVHLSGRIDNYNSLSFQRSVDQLINAGFRYIVFCCTNLSHVSSTGIGAFSSIHDKLLALRGNMYMALMQPRVYDVFQILGYSDFLDFCDTADDALAKLKRSLEGSPPRARFPLAIQCPACSKKLKALKPGKFVCGTCKTRIVVSAEGLASLWTADLLG